MPSRLNEDLMNTNLDIPDGEIKITGMANPAYADAINVHKKKKKETEKVMKDKKPELKKAFLGTKGETTIMPKTKDMKKLKLSEDMFKNVREHFNDAPKQYEGIFRVVDNIEHIVNYINELSEESLTYDDMKQSYSVLEEAVNEFKGYLADIEKAEKKSRIKEDVDTLSPTQKAWSLKDKRNNKDIWSDIYNELVDLKDIESPHRQIKGASRYGALNDNQEIFVGVSYQNDKDAIVVRANSEEQLDFGKKVAETYDVDYEVKEYKSRYAPFKFELFIYPYSYATNEGLTKAQRHNKHLDKIFDDKRRRDADMMKFIKANSDASEEEIQKAYDNDKVGLLLKNLGLHDKYWSKNECIGKNRKKKNLKESYIKVDTIECGEDTYRVIGGGFNPSAEALISVEDEHGERTRIHMGDVIEFYTWYDRNGKVIHEPSDMDESFRKRKSKKTKNEDLKIYRESDLSDFEFWAGARDTVKYLTEDEIIQIGRILEDAYPDGCTETDINDFFWFEDDTIADWLGYESFEEIMNRNDD